MPLVDHHSHARTLRANVSKNKAKVDTQRIAQADFNTYVLKQHKSVSVKG